MRPMAAAVAGALISGIGMYAVGTRAAQNPLVDQTALVQTADGQFAYVQASALRPLPQTQAIARPQTVAFTASPTPVVYTAPAPRVVERRIAPAAQERYVYQEVPKKRSWQKSALVIGGSAASGAGVGAIVGGKKGALIGTALGGGAASIYEAIRRR